MKQKQQKTWWSSALSLLLVALMTVQLAVPAFAVDGQLPAEEEIMTENPLPQETEATEAPQTTEEMKETEDPQTTEVPETSEELKTDEKSLPAANPEQALEIPGYTRVNNAQLDHTKYYMIVSKDSAGHLYAFYPDKDKANTDPGNAIVPNHKNGCPEGTFVAELTVDAEKKTVTAKRATAEKTPLDMQKLHFRLEKHGSQWGFVDQNGLYLSLATTMLTTEGQYLTVTAKDGVFTIQNGYRHLDFNKAGDPNEFRKGLATNFWGPGENRFPIYLYVKDGETVQPVVNKAALNGAIKKAAELNVTIFSEASVKALNAAVDAGKAEAARQDSTEESVALAIANIEEAILALCPKADLLAPTRPNPDHGTTHNEPFPAGIGGSKTFRIPALITLNNGDLAAAIDARWDACPDGFGIDTLFSVSHDNGKTWHYSFPNYFNDSVDQYWGGGRNQGKATSFLDPVMIQGKDNTIYLMTDVFPGGVYIGSAATDNGYREIDGKQRMILYLSANGQNQNGYAYYIGDFEKAGENGKSFAPVIDKNDTTNKTPVYYVDEHYNLYTAKKNPMYCQQLGTHDKPLSGKYVQQNVFYYNAALHVRNATYLWMVTSKDNGKTWSAPTIMNPMVRKNPATHKFYGVGPGAGLCLDDGTVMLPCYLHSPERSSFIYKNPGEDTWHRSDDATTDTSSESTLVQIDKDTVRQFCRDEHAVLRYTDHKRNAEGKWIAQTPVKVEGVPKTTMNQVSAIRYSMEINGKPVIMVSTAATGSRTRENGKIYAFNLENDEGRTMKLIGTYEVNKLGEVYGYSSLTELTDGSIGLLYEDTWIHASYRNIYLNEIVPSAVVDGKRTVRVSLYNTVADGYEFKTLPTEAELAQMDSSIATAKIVDGKVMYTGHQIGQTSYTTGGVTVVVQVMDSSRVQEVSLKIEQSQDISVESGKIQWNTKPNAVDAKITTVDKSVTVTGGQCHLGTDAKYNGTLEPLAKGLHIIEADGNGFQVYAKDAGGKKIWLDPAAALGTPISLTPKKVQFEQQNDGTFFIKNEGRYLAFWRDGKNVFDAGSSAGGNMTALCKFKLYRPVQDGEKSSAELPGYIQVQQLKDVQSGGMYLIVADSKNENYLLWPSSDTGSKYAHVAKADKSAKNVTHTVDNKLYTLTLTGKAVGVSDVVVNDVVYRVSVSCDHVFGEEWKHDGTSHWHECSCGEKKDQAEHTFGEWIVSKEPTEKETGLKVHSCTVCGYEERVEIPVVPVEPEKPTEPDNSTEPEAPTAPDPSTEPEAPTDSSAPSDSTTVPTTPNKGDTPQTGDNSRVILWVMMTIVSGLCMTAAVICGKKKYHI